MLEGLLVVGPFNSERRETAAYCGFDGQFWPGANVSDPILEGTLLPFGDYERAIRFLRASSARTGSRLIAICDEGPSLPNVNFVGFDLGVLESSYSHFSLVLNDIINKYGHFHHILRELNTHGLFAKRADAEAFLQTRLQCCASDLEEIEEGVARVFAIWLLNQG